MVVALAKILGFDLAERSRLRRSVLVPLGSVKQKLLWQTSLNIGAHEGHLEFIERDLATVVCVEPVEHFVEEDLLLLLREALAKGANERLAHGLALVEVQPAIAVFVRLVEGLGHKLRELLSHPFHVFLLLLGSLVDKVVEHQRLLEVGTNELCRRRLNDVLDSIDEARLDLNVDLHADDLRGLWVHLQAPDEDLRLVCCGTHQELAAIAGLVSNDHRGGVLEAEDLADALLTAGVRIKHLLDDRLRLVRIDVPDLKLATLRANQKVVLVDLVQVGGVLLVVDLRLDAFSTCLDVNITDQDLLTFEARNRQNCRRSLKEGLGVELDHSVAGARLRPANEFGCHWRLSLLSLILFRNLFLHRFRLSSSLRALF